MEKFGTKPGFCQVHDIVHHDVWKSMLDCWQLEASAWNPEWTSLQVFAKAKQSWEAITEMSESIIEKYIATMATLSEARDKTGHE